MSYAIANVIYGIPITKENFFDKLENLKMHQIPKSFLEEHFNDLEGLSMEDVATVFGENGSPFTSKYSGSADETPMWFGLELDSFDETANVRISDLQLEPSLVQALEVKVKFEELPEFIREILKDDKIDVHIVWSTS